MILLFSSRRGGDTICLDQFILRQSHFATDVSNLQSEVMGSEVTVSEVIAAEVTVLVNATQIWELCRIRNIIVKSCFSSSSSSFDVNLPQQRA